MKTQGVVLPAMTEKLPRWQAAEIAGISKQQMARWRQHSSQHAGDELFDRHRSRRRDVRRFCFPVDRQGRALP
jgi:hypothetical protein